MPREHRRGGRRRRDRRRASRCAGARRARERAASIVTNPPYGVRLADSHALAEFYPRLGDALKQRFAGWTAYLLSGDPRLPKLIGLKASRRTPLFNGAIECRLYEYRMVAGSMRPRRRARAGVSGDDRMASSYSHPRREPAMMLPSRHYESEHTSFIRELLQERPDLVEKQREGRAIWWDKTPRELAEERTMDQGRVPQSPYVYDATREPRSCGSATRGARRASTAPSATARRARRR